MAAGLNFAGAMISTKVASTIGKGIVNASNITQMVVLAGVSAPWSGTWSPGIRIPSSSSHAIIGGLVGWVILAGSKALHWQGLKKIVTVLLVRSTGPCSVSCSWWHCCGLAETEPLTG